ncbi:MAG: hypothetical protein D6773_02145, partial [Alphaproteobacteria bacterium]
MTKKEAPMTDDTGPGGGDPLPIADPRQMGHILYGLYAAGFLTGGVTAIAGVIMAYMKRDDYAGTWMASH